MNTSKTAAPRQPKTPQNQASETRSAVPVLDSEDSVYSSQEVGGLSIFLGDGTYRNGKPFKYHA